jgi:hypothetical protein
VNALDMLEKTETPTRIFGWDEDYKEMPYDHPVALAERYGWLAVMSSDRNDGNDETMVIFFCSKMWALRDRLDQPALEDMANLLTSLATAYPALSEMAIESIEGLTDTIWEAYRIRLSSEVLSEEALKDAMARMAALDEGDEGYRSVLISERTRSRRGSIAEA